MPVPVNLISKFIRAGLLSYDKTYYGFPDENLWGASNLYFPVDPTISFGEKIIEVKRSTVIGEGRAGSGASYDIPLISIHRDLGYTIVENVYAGAQWAMDELSNAILEARTKGVVNNFVQEEMSGVRIALDRRCHRMVIEGLPERGVYGVFNNPSIGVTDLTTTIDFGAMTGAAILAWLQTQALTFATAMSIPLNRLYVYVGKELFEKLIAPFSDQNSTSVSDLLLNTRGLSLGGIEYIPELSHDALQGMGVFTNGDNKARIMIGTMKDPRACVRYYYAPNRTDVFVKDTGIHFGLTGFCATSAVEFKRPEYFKYIDVKAVPK